MVFNIVFVGKFIPRKGLLQLIIASISLHKNVKLFVYGGGPLKFVVKIASYWAPRVIFYKGFIPKNDLLKDLSNYDILCVPSKREAFGLVYLEALNAGVPVILLENEGIFDVVKEYNLGFVIKDNRIFTLRRVLKNLKKVENVELPPELKWEQIMKVYLDEV